MNAIDQARSIVAVAGIAIAVAACAGHKSYIDEYVTSSGGASGTSGVTQTGGTSASGVGAASTDGASTGGTAGSSFGGEAGSAGQPGVSGDLLYIKASNPDAQDAFASSIALSEKWLAIAAPRESSNATGLGGDQLDDSEDRSGAVYLFSDDGEGWAQRAYIKSSNSEAGDNFGFVLALSGNTLAVATPYEDGAARGINGDQGNGGGNNGAVYVFVEAGGEWQQQAYIKTSNIDPVDLFGSSMALEGDVIVAGAPWEDGAGTGIGGDELSNAADASGAVYVFVRSDGEWTQDVYLKASNTAADAEFGKAVAISGNTIVVGAPGESSSAPGVNPGPAAGEAPDSGAVYVFERVGSSYQQTTFIKASNPDADDAFGSHVALAGDTLAVTAIGEATANGDGTQSNNSLPDSGAVYVFERSAGSWSQVEYLKPSDLGTDNWFGTALAFSGDTLFVGAIGHENSGTVYVFQRGARTWLEVDQLKAPNAESSDFFGSSIAVTPTLLAIGADNEASDSPGINGDSANDRTPGAGAAFLYKR